MMKNTELSPEEYLRYDRQIILTQLGTEGQIKLKNSSVLLIGAGGLGSPAALYLAGAGVGHIGIMDADEVSVSNLQRQIAHSMETEGMNKALSAKQTLEKLNDRIRVSAYPFRLTPENAAEYIGQYDFILDCCDSFETKFLINDTCVIMKKPFCHAGILRFEGQVMTWVPDGNHSCYRCVFEEIPDKGSVPNCSQAGIIGAVAGITGTVQALETVKYFTGAGELLLDRLFTFDGLTMKTRLVKFSGKNPECRVCSDRADIKNPADLADYYIQKNNCLSCGGETEGKVYDSMTITVADMKKLEQGSYQLIDIRSDMELSYGKIPGSVHIKADELDESDIPDKSGRPVIICCSRGEYSVEAAEKLREKGVNAVSLEGGYRAWLMDVINEPAERVSAADAELSLRKKFRKTIWCKFTKAINIYEMVKPGDSIAVCISGGKDSMLMAKCFQELKLHNKFDFDVKFLVMDPGYSPDNRKIIEENAKNLNIPVTIFESQIFDSVYNIEKSPCYLCARMRRGHLYSFAKQMGCNKIALGHHYDDVIETILMGMLYGAQVQTMMPKLHSTNFEGMELIRPLYLVREDDIKAWRDYNKLHFIQCACKFTDTCVTCDNEENKSKRIEIKELIKTLKKTNPLVENHIFRSVENVNLDTVIAYKKDGKKISFLDNYDSYEFGSGKEEE